MFLACPEMFNLLTTKHHLIKPWWEMTWGFWYFLINQIQAVKRKRCTKIIKIIYRVKTSDYNMERTDLRALIGFVLFMWSVTWLWLVVGMLYLNVWSIRYEVYLINLNKILYVSWKNQILLFLKPKGISTMRW